MLVWADAFQLILFCQDNAFILFFFTGILIKALICSNMFLINLFWWATACLVFLVLGLLGRRGFVDVWLRVFFQQGYKIGVKVDEIKVIFQSCIFLRLCQGIFLNLLNRQLYSLSIIIHLGFHLVGLGSKMFMGLVVIFDLHLCWDLIV